MLCAALLAWPLALYPLLLRRLNGGRAQGSKDSAPASVTVLVPVFNEEANIAARLEDLARAGYPSDRLEVLVCNDCSTDATADLAEQYFQQNPEFSGRVVTRAVRVGKSGALNQGIAEALGEVVVVTDALTRFRPDVLRLVAERFADPKVGAVTGHFIATGDGRLWQREEARFWRGRNFLRQHEAAVDSTPFLSGDLCAFRRDLVHRIDEDSLADDMNVALQVRAQGYRVVVEPRAIFWKPRSSVFSELLEAKSRRAAGGIQELWRFRRLFFRPRYGWFGMLILPSNALTYLPIHGLLALPLVWRAGKAFLGLPKLAQTACVAATGALIARSWETLLMLAFNELILMLGWKRLLTGRMDPRYVREASTRLRSAHN